jgi:RNA polymerase sigma factor (sigma-70 family)
MSPLTPQQRELVAQNVGLVRIQVRRQLQRLPLDIRRREREDLVQVGTLGLMRAATRYRPDHHGPFATYALAYIHGSLCRYLLRQMNGLAVPTRQAVKIVRQRRLVTTSVNRLTTSLPSGRSGTAVRGGGAACPDVPPLPQFFELHTSSSSVAKVACRLARDAAQAEVAFSSGNGRGEADHGRAGSCGGWTTQEFHERYLQALAWAASKVTASRSARIDQAALVNAVLEERLRVRDSQFRTPRRALATRFGCSARRVWNLEARVVRLVRRRLAAQAGLSRDATTLICRRIP